MHHETRNTYSRSASKLHNYYNDIGPREGDVVLAFTLAGNPESPSVLELGCGNGRDAGPILRRTPYYLGLDTSEEAISCARHNNPGGDFLVADILTHTYAGPYDIIFAFAVLRHLDKDEVTTVLKKAYDALRGGGILYLSTNFGQAYGMHKRHDEYGTREIYYYNPRTLHKIMPPGFKVVQELHDLVSGKPWFDMALCKKA